MILLHDKRDVVQRKFATIATEFCCSTLSTCGSATTESENFWSTLYL